MPGACRANATYPTVQRSDAFIPALTLPHPHASPQTVTVVEVSLFPCLSRATVPTFVPPRLQWLNGILEKVWPYYDAAICAAIKVGALCTPSCTSAHLASRPGLGGPACCPCLLRPVHCGLHCVESYVAARCNELVPPLTLLPPLWLGAGASGAADGAVQAAGADQEGTAAAGIAAIVPLQYPTFACPQGT